MDNEQMNVNENASEENVESNAQGGNELNDIDDGTIATFEDIINHPDYRADYQKAVDKAVSKAINSYKKNHDTDIEKLVSEQVSAKVRDVKFNASLKEHLKDAGVIDNTAFLAHMDLQKLKDSFDDTTESFKGFDELISESKEKMPYLFKVEKEVPNTTGQAQNSFGKNKKEIKTLQDALHAKYKI